MENNNNQNNENQNKGNQGKGDQQKQGSGSGSGVLSMLQPHDMSRTVESAMHVFQGRSDKLPDLMQDMGHIILKASRKLTTTQLILAAGALTIGAILASRYSPQVDDYEEAA
ncbi:hypothetical protein [Pontibacter akesuensis]|uniref:Recombination associated protein RdgC n=1 Tax=Pontibacter akesuensis TaxID=388950 RepID=A0A1I7FH59_9BACT|nr:hypothetical protein [Pontibacter akesuensis]GHA62190.1 hypothetical protein GCM10007389_13590 [Pontibacter akesuensis]SFU35542.1 hypothetical protein SAMN04487941_0199 [Pontibacter akesuensis]